MIRERILQFIEYKSITKYRFYQDLGFSNGFLDKEGAIGSDKCEKIIYHFPDLNPLWLLTGKGNMLIGSVENEHSEVFKLKSDSQIDMQRIPLYSENVAAGMTKLYKDNTPTDEYISIPNMPKCDAARHAVGDSMYPLIKSGDIMAYKIIKDKNMLIYGQMYIIAFNQDGDDYELTKYIQRSEKGEDYIKLVSENRHHDPIHILKSSIIDIAMVKATIRFHSR